MFYDWFDSLQLYSKLFILFIFSGLFFVENIHR